MRLEHLLTLKGHRALCQISDTLLTGRRNKLYLFDIPTRRQTMVGVLKMSFKDWLIAQSRLLRRVFRFGIQCSIPLTATVFLISYKNTLYSVDIASSAIDIDKQNRPGFRPLAFSRIAGVPGFDKLICYGEYVSNRQKQPIHIFGRSEEGDWKSLFTFPIGEIEHIHSLVPDPYRQCVWILTGDYDQAAAIWLAKDNFQHIECVLRGSQKNRCSTAYPVPEGLLYATDSHLEKNSIRMLYSVGGKWLTRQLYSMVGSCIYSVQLGDTYYFSTAYEPGKPMGNRLRDLLEIKPGPGIKSSHCEVIAGNPQTGFTCVLRWKVDRLPKRLFQFSSIRFPVIYGQSSDLLAVYGTGCKGHNDRTELFYVRQ